MNSTSTAPRQLPVRDYLALKASFRDLVRQAGGVAAAARITRGTISRLSEAMSPEHMDRFPALDQVADLEAESGTTTVSRMLASLSDCDVVAREQAAAPASIHALLTRVVQEQAEVTNGIIAMLADGQISEAEREQACAEIDQAVASLHDLRHKIKASRLLRVLP